MKKETIKKVMEQIRSKKNVANELAAMAEVNVNVATMAAAQAEGGEIVERTISVPANAVELAVYSADAIGVEGNFYSDEGGWVGYYYPNQTYYYTICRVKAEEVGISEDAFKAGKLWLTFSNESSGMKVFEIYNSNGDYVCDWGYEIPVAEVYNEATNQAEFMVVPSMGCTGSILFTKSDFSITYNEVVTLQSISVTTPPTKTVYLEGETFDPAGMVVTATYSDGSTAEVSGYTYSPNGALTASDTSVTISYTEAGVTKTATQTITVYPTANVYYANTTNDKQKMDIYVPENLGNNVKVPAVITIHGGSWCGGDKATSHYHNNTDNNDMSDFITNTCNCVHVNMNYRLTTGDPSNNGITYVQMLEDIQSVISYLQNHANVYHINPGKIALMGYSAGGHLAMLYAYQNPTQIDLVISEAGPTYFATSAMDPNPIYDNNIQAMVGSNNAVDLYNASPLKYATSNVPYTILAYGNGVFPNNNDNYIGDYGDGVLPYTQATVLQGVLGENNCPLFELTGVGHNDFGVGKQVYPNVAIEENDDAEERALKTVIQNYYGAISSNLQELARQEN